MNHVSLVLLIPIVAIVGGITVAIFRTYGQQKVAEWAMKERIAAIEKGLDPATLPPLPQVGDPEELATGAMSPRQRAIRTSEGLFIAGAITCFSGLGLALMFVLLDVGPRNLWSVGALAIFVGVGLLVSGGLVRQGASERPDLLPDRSPPAR
jgi:hypothetical protein